MCLLDLKASPLLDLMCYDLEPYPLTEDHVNIHSHPDIQVKIIYITQVQSWARIETVTSSINIKAYFHYTMSLIK